MRYSHQHKFILINNWKCACSSVCEMFDPYCDPCGDVKWVDADGKQRNKFCKELVGKSYGYVVHAPATRIKEIFGSKGWNFDEYTKISSVRNPWERIVSLYHYQAKQGMLGGQGVRDGGPWKNYPNSPDKTRVQMGFTEYVKTVLPNWRAGQINRYNTYEMFHDYDGKNLVDHTVKLENLKEELVPIVEEHFPEFYINYDVRVNASKHAHYSKYYDDESKHIVGEIFSYDIETWEYQFEGRIRPVPLGG